MVYLWIFIILPAVQAYGKYILIYQLQYQKIAFNIDFLFVTFLVFPAWEPSSNDVLCAKFLYFYRSKCFDKNVEEKITKKIVGKRDAERLQRITNSSDVFTNLFHEFFLQIFLNLSCWKRKRSSYWSKTGFFLSLPVEKEIITNIC